MRRLMQRIRACLGGRRSSGYGSWIRRNEPSASELRRQRAAQAGFSKRPKISIIVPVFNPDPAVVREMFRSVEAQTYDNWELCVADASTSENAVSEVLASCKRIGQRVRLIRLERNLGISGNTNEALSLATGDYCLFLDHDDELAPFALFEMVALLNRRPGAGFIYSDRDIITENGVRLSPFFKPNWSPDLLLSQNYLCHAALIHKEIADSLGGFRREYDGSQDYDYFLRATELAGKIEHLPKVLYHWRMVEGSSAVDSGAKPYAYKAAIKALAAALNRRGWDAEARHGFDKGYYEISFSFQGRSWGVVFLCGSAGEQVDALARRFGARGAARFAALVSTQKPLQGGSGPQEIKYFQVSGDGDAITALNRAVEWMDTDVVLFMDLRYCGDLEVVVPDSSLGLAARSDTALVVPRIVQRNGNIISTGLAFSREAILRLHQGFPADSIGYNGMARCLHNVSGCEPICFLFSKRAFLQLGGFSAVFPGLFASEFAIRGRGIGLLTCYDPSFEAVVSCAPPLTRVDDEYGEFLARFPELKNGDFYYNPNFDHTNGGYNIA